jgi:hypothetical protein
MTKRATSNGQIRVNSEIPDTVYEAVVWLLDKMPLKFKSQLTRTPEEDLGDLHFLLVLNIRNEFIYMGNPELLDSCRKIVGETTMEPDLASHIIIKELWRELRATHKIKVLK